MRGPLSDRKFIFFSSGSSLLALVLIFALTSHSGESSGEELPLEVEMLLSFTGQPLSEKALSGPGPSFLPYGGERRTAQSSFAYLWVRLQNTSQVHRQFIFQNRSRNFYTQVLVPQAFGSQVLFEHGDKVPLSRAPLPFMKTAFPLGLAPGESREFVLEYHGPRGLVVDPFFTSEQEFLGSALVDVGVLALIYGMLLVLLVLNSLFGLMQRIPFARSVAFFLAALIFFSLRQTRYLQFLFPDLAYPDWLFPLSVGLNLAAALVLTLVLLKDHLLKWQKFLLRVFLATVAALVVLSFFYRPYEVADFLNFLSLTVLVVIVWGLVLAMLSHDRSVLAVAVSFLPWIVTMVVDIILTFLGHRPVLWEQYRQSLALVVSQILLFITILYYYGDPQRRLATLKFQALKQWQRKMVPLAQNTIIPLLESIRASAWILSREYAEPRLLALGQIIREETDRLSALLVESWDQPPEAGREILPLEEILSSSDMVQRDSLGKIGVFHGDVEQAGRLGLVLGAAGFSVIQLSDPYVALETTVKGNLDMLLLDGGQDSPKALDLCRLVREQFNTLDRPLLMILDPGDQATMEEAYAAGVNDYILRPYEARELVTRVQSLLRLRKTVLNNQELARSEKEKNTFLYFLTHNVNTPLTILLNRVQEFSRLKLPLAQEEAVRDLQSSTREIQEIVQTVLLSFRLADGRHTVFMDSFDPGEVAHAVAEDLGVKARAKGQSLVHQIPAGLPRVRGDALALRGVLYNLLDNGIKFTPPGGLVELTLSVPGFLQVEVSDSGPGIPVEERDRLFCRFERLSTRPTSGESSTGLGLYVARELMILQGGTLGYRDCGKGACFVLTLPLASGSAAAVQDGAGE